MATRNNQRKKATKPKKGQRRAKTGWNQQVHRSMTLSRPLIAPDELDTKLMYRKSGVLTSNATPLVSAEFQPNCAYDVDPTLGSTETYGFDEYAALYSYYRVIGYSYDISFAANTNYPCMVYVTNTNVTVPGTSFYLYTTQPYSHSALASVYAARPTRFRGSVTLSQLTGTNAVETADTYRALTTGVPTDKVFLTIAAEHLQTSSLEPGVGYDVRITMHVRFYSREVDLTLASYLSRLQSYQKARKITEASKTASFPLGGKP